MKKVLILLIVLSLFSYLLAWTKSCPQGLKMACKKYTIDSCQCVNKDISGDYAYVKDCTEPQVPLCSGDNTCLNCICT